MSRVLATRLRRLEKRRRHRRPMPPVLMCIYPDEQTGPVTGARATRAGYVQRRYDEDLDGFAIRASAELGERVMQACY